MKRAITRASASAAAILATVSLTAACSSSNAGTSTSGAGTPATTRTATSSGAQSGTLTIRATDQLRFQPSTLRVYVGTVRIRLVDDGSYPHNFSVPALHTTSATVSGNPGEQDTTVTLRFARPGTYSFICTYHASAGMRGTIVVQN